MACVMEGSFENGVLACGFLFRVDCDVVGAVVVAAAPARREAEGDTPGAGGCGECDGGRAVGWVSERDV